MDVERNRRSSHQHERPQVQDPFFGDPFSVFFLVGSRNLDEILTEPETEPDAGTIRTQTILKRKVAGTKEQRT